MAQDVGGETVIGKPMTDEEIYADMMAVAEWQAREVQGPDYGGYIEKINTLRDEIESLYYKILTAGGKGDTRFLLFQAVNHLGNAVECIAEARDE